MTGQGKDTGGKDLLDLLGEGDIAGLEAALGMNPGEFGRLMLGVPRILGESKVPDEPSTLEDEDWLAEEDEDWLPRPEWLHPDCRSVCAALDLGACCKYPDNPVVRVAVDLADFADRVVSRLGETGREAGCAECGAELARCFRKIPGLLAQIHAVLPRLSQTARAQLLCPVGTLASALDQACGGGCPWGCGHPGTSDRRDDFRPIIELVAESSTAIRTAVVP